MKHSVIGIDLAKNIFQICALNKNNEVVFNQRVKRHRLLHVLRQFEPTLIVMETCYSSNHWGREMTKLGHQVKLIPAFRVKPFVVGNKNDANDALAICEAALRPQMKFVTVKTLTQQDIQTVYRIREREMKNRVALINQLRGLLSEYGFFFAKTPRALKKAIPELLEDGENQLTSIARAMVYRLFEQWERRDKEIKTLDKQLLDLVQQHSDYTLLMSIPGVGPIVSALIMASVTDPNQFKNGRQMAAWVGLTPKQFASGEINRLSKISKRGNVDPWRSDSCQLVSEKRRCFKFVVKKTHG